MPAGSPYQGHIPPYPSIRVDAFSSPHDPLFQPAHLHLLTHTHSDHITGLDAHSFSQLVTCSIDSKEMLLNGERAPQRKQFQEGTIEIPQRPWAHLRTTRKDRKSVPPRDLLRTIRLNEPEVFTLTGTESVVVTALDANHCPGAVMYLIEGPRGAILHTGDFRAEPTFIESLKRNPFIEKYLVQDPELDFSYLNTASQPNLPSQRLEAIYIDTACLLGTVYVPSKKSATDGLVVLMGHFPPNTRFFINTWTWGYEDVLKAVARAFQCKIHVDRYKHRIYNLLKSEPLLQSIITDDAASTRFHACERWNRCAHVEEDDKDVVYINPVECPRLAWEKIQQDISAQLLAEEPVTSLPVPLARHSTLPELIEFVKLFLPKRVVPNTLIPQLQGADWAYVASVFEPYMAPGGRVAVLRDMRQHGFRTWGTPDPSKDISLTIDMVHQVLEPAAIGLKSATWQNIILGKDDVSVRDVVRTLTEEDHDVGSTLAQRKDGRLLRMQEQLLAMLADSRTTNDWMGTLLDTFLVKEDDDKASSASNLKSPITQSSELPFHRLSSTTPPRRLVESYNSYETTWNSSLSPIASKIDSPIAFPKPFTAEGPLSLTTPKPTYRLPARRQSPGSYPELATLPNMSPTPSEIVHSGVIRIPILDPAQFLNGSPHKRRRMERSISSSTTLSRPTSVRPDVLLKAKSLGPRKLRGGFVSPKPSSEGSQEGESVFMTPLSSLTKALSPEQSLPPSPPLFITSAAQGKYYTIFLDQPSGLNPTPPAALNSVKYPSGTPITTVTKSLVSPVAKLPIALSSAKSKNSTQSRSIPLPINTHAQQPRSSFSLQKQKGSISLDRTKRSSKSRETPQTDPAIAARQQRERQQFEEIRAKLKRARDITLIAPPSTSKSTFSSTAMLPPDTPVSTRKHSSSSAFGSSPDQTMDQMTRDGPVSLACLLESQENSLAIALGLSTPQKQSDVHGTPRLNKQKTAGKLSQSSNRCLFR